MQTLSFHDFVSNSQSIIGDAKNLVVASYGKIQGFPDGLTSKNTESGKVVKIVAGGGEFNGVSLFGLFHFDHPNPEFVQATKDAGLKKVAEQLSEVPESTFVVLYAGTSRLIKMIHLAGSLARKGARVALLSCGCDPMDRFSHIDDMPNNDKMLVIVPNHPGFCDSEYEDLGIIASKFLN
jgi:hypothetical protein